MGLLSGKQHQRKKVKQYAVLGKPSDGYNQATRIVDKRQATTITSRYVNEQITKTRIHFQELLSIIIYLTRGYQLVCFFVTC